MTSDDDDYRFEVPAITVEVTEPQEVGRLYGPGGETLLILLDRSWVPFGFQPPG